MVKRVLMIAFHYPPQAGSSGVQRTLKFAEYLPQFGWEPTILTAHPRAYSRVSAGNPTDSHRCAVHRAFALDASRHLAVMGRYLRITALPDRWATWWLGAVPTGLRLLREQRFDAIWSTYPIATAHKIALSLQRRSGVPWIADFRDPMTEPGFPPDPRMHHAYRRIEQATIAECTRAVFTTPGTLAAYKKNFPVPDSRKFCMIENGYDEDDFIGAMTLPLRPRTAERPFTLLHSGIVYPSERDPRSLFGALSEMLRARMITPRNFKLVLRASGHDDLLQKMIDNARLSDIVSLQPPIPYADALSEMLSADGLLLLQASNCNNQIPAKLYEYLRAQRPILALTDPLGDTATALRKAGIDSIARLDDKGEIASAILSFMQQIQSGQAKIAGMELVQANSRFNRTGELATLMDDGVRD